MRVCDFFRELLDLGDDMGMVEAAHMYNDNYCSIDGLDREGNKFTLSLSLERIPLCEKINDEENEK